jgi:L-lactate dehydrogenase complex protein LldE
LPNNPLHNIPDESDIMKPIVQLFVTCIVDTLYPEIGEAVVDVLERAGVQVQFPEEQTCCGQPAFNAGTRELALPMAMHTIRVFEDTPGSVVIPSGSCAAMIRHGYLELFAGDPSWMERARKLAARTFEFSEYLVDVLGITDVGASFPGRLSYHASCHQLRDLQVKDQPRLLLQSVRSSGFIELPESQDCCGFGGVFSVEHPELSAAMLERKIANITKSQADVVVACDAGCIIHINGGLQRQGRPGCAMHLAEILNLRTNSRKTDGNEA